MEEQSGANTIINGTNTNNITHSTSSSTDAQINSNHAPSIPPSSPFELRRHRSFYDGSTSTGTNTTIKRRASAKCSAMPGKSKSGHQILNFFRSQSHEPKQSPLVISNNNNNNNELHVSTEVEGGEGTVPIPKARKTRPQSLYAKTTSSKGCFQHRVSGIVRTPETPDDAVTPPERRRGLDGDSAEDNHDVMTPSNSTGGGPEGEEGLSFEINEDNNVDNTNRQRMLIRGDALVMRPPPSRATSGGGNCSSSRSSVSSSDSFASCEVQAVVKRKSGSSGENGTSLEGEDQDDSIDKDRYFSSKYFYFKLLLESYRAQI